MSHAVERNASPRVSNVDRITYKIDFHVETDPYATVAGRIA